MKRQMEHLVDDSTMLLQFKMLLQFPNAIVGVDIYEGCMDYGSPHIEMATVTVFRSSVAARSRETQSDFSVTNVCSESIHGGQKKVEQATWRFGDVLFMLSVV